MSDVCFFEPFDQTKRPKSRVELHLHLDGSFRISTIWDLAKKKGMHLGYDTIEELRNALTIKHPTTLAEFLKPSQIFMPVFAGDGDAIERAAYELCEDQSKDGVLYFEARYSPQGLSNTYMCPGEDRVPLDSTRAFTPRMVVQSINRGLKRGQLDFGIKARSILCCIRGIPEWSNEVLDLCQEFSSDGVVGIDIAGIESLPAGHCGTELNTQDDADIFKKAAALGIHRTVHAGEAGPAANVAFAIKEMLAERIGHGYRVLDDNAIYEQLLHTGIHLETCPYSSLLTGAVPLGTTKHPIVKFCEDGANFSINKDDTTQIGKTLNDEYTFLAKMGLDHSHFTKANFNAARSCFLPDDEKQQLVQQLQEIYGYRG